MDVTLQLEDVLKQKRAAALFFLVFTSGSSCGETSIDADSRKIETTFPILRVSSFVAQTRPPLFAYIAVGIGVWFVNPLGALQKGGQWRRP